MAINHKFLNHNFGDGFLAEDTILRNADYKPEILFIGTYNPATNQIANVADFFYGRNWFWPALFNIFNGTAYSQQRKFNQPLTPTLNEIFLFCRKHKIIFADLIGQTLHNTNDYTLHNNIAVFDGEFYNLISDNDLADLDNLHQVNWVTKNILAFLKLHPSVKTIYFTRQPKEPFSTQLAPIIAYANQNKINFLKIFTPSGQGLRGRPRMDALINHWKQNVDPNYDRLCNDLSAEKINYNR